MPPDYERTPLHYAAKYGHIDVVQILLDVGADCNKSDELGYTPLHYAAKYGHINVVQILLDGGADFNKSDELGYTPLQMAEYKGNQDVVKMLKDRGALQWFDNLLTSKEMVEHLYTEEYYYYVKATPIIKVEFFQQ